MSKSVTVQVGQKTVTFTSVESLDAAIDAGAEISVAQYRDLREQLKGDESADGQSSYTLGFHRNFDPSTGEAGRLVAAIYDNGDYVFSLSAPDEVWAMLLEDHVQTIQDCLEAGTPQEVAEINANAGLRKWVSRREYAQSNPQRRGFYGRRAA